MLKILSDLNMANRIEVTPSADVLASGVAGTWVSFVDGDYPAADGDHGGPIWTESNRDGTAGWTPDVDATGKLTVLSGYVRAQTDQVGSVTAGDYLMLDTAGKLKTCAGGSGNNDQIRAVAVCTKTGLSVTQLGKTYTGCIEFITI